MATQNSVNNSLGTTAYAVICGGTTATGSVQPIASLGTSGQILTSNGAGSLPTMQDAPTPGGMVLIETQTASSSANLSFTTGITSTYTSYVFVLNAVIPATNAQVLNLTFSVDGGSNYLATGYLAGVNTNAYNSATISNANSTTTIPLTGSQVNTAAIGISGNIYLYNITTASNPGMTSNLNWNDGTTRFAVGVASNSTTSGVDAFRFAFASGNISSGTISLYGVTK